MTSPRLRTLLLQTLQGGASHVEKLTIAAAVISEVLREHGMEATLVGGAAIELHAPGIYATSDLDFIVEGRSRTELDAALTGFGFERRGRHWVLGELFVEVPGNWMSDPVDVIDVDGLQLRVVRREIVLADRIIGFKHWRSTAYGAQALALLQVFGTSIDQTLLHGRLRAEHAEDALTALRRLADARHTVGEPELAEALATLHSRPGTEP